MKVQELKRVFLMDSLKLADPDPAMAPEMVKAFYANQYPELVNATIITKNEVDKIEITFKQGVGQKG